MEKNTICIDILEYNRLRDFEQSIMRGDIGIKYFSECYGDDLHFLKENEVVSDLNTHIKMLDEENEELTTENKALKEAMKKHPIEITVKLTDKEIAKFSIMQFLKFRKRFKKQK